MALTVQTPASALPLSLAEVKAHCRIDINDDDSLLTSYIAAATDMAEHQIGRAIMPQTLCLSLDRIAAEFIELPRPPLQSVTSFMYVTSSGIYQTWTAGNYQLLATDAGPAKLYPVYGQAWPDYRQGPNAIKVAYVAGYADASAVPMPIKHWLKLMVGTMYENRESYDESQSYQLGFADRLLDRYKVWSL